MDVEDDSGLLVWCCVVVCLIRKGTGMAYGAQHSVSGQWGCMLRPSIFVLLFFFYDSVRFVPRTTQSGSR